MLGDVRRARGRRGGDARLRRRSATWRPPPTSARSRPSRPGPTELNAMGTLNVLEAARDSGRRARRLRLDRLGLLRRARRRGRRGHAARAARPPLHGRQARGRAVLPLLRRALRAASRPSLRFGIPYGPRARPAAVIPSFVRRALGRRAADDRRQRRAAARLRLRRGPRRGRGPGAAPRAPPGAPTTSAGRRRRRSAGWPRSSRPRSPPSPIVHTEGRAADLHGATILSDRAEDELGWTASTPLAEGVRALRGLAAVPARGRPRAQAGAARPAVGRAGPAPARRPLAPRRPGGRARRGRRRGAHRRPVLPADALGRGDRQRAARRRDDGRRRRRCCRSRR